MTSTEQIQLENIADVDHEIFALLKQRYSPRIFKDEKISEQQLNQLFEAARWSASSNNIQPWRFLYAEKDTDTYDKILDCLSDFNKKWASNAPLLMLTAYKEKTEEDKENFHALHDLGLCMGSMTVQAQYMGIALHHMAGVDWKKAHEIFNVPEGYHVTTAVAMGYYGGDLDALPNDLQKQEVATRKRIPQSEFVYKGVWGGQQ
ncbi:nitroreductase family protein [Arenibacter latericius]|uniref:nitroreductase family protein n=1 Tax=Arenibacter latericius TaxID=86104 RepID=UPI000422FD5D|nr:nitroreductase family protein [Arenibacter latericius]MDX1363445.1 nitroreductase family protein [Arenibacter latericius]